MRPCPSSQDSRCAECFASISTVTSAKTCISVFSVLWLPATVPVVHRIVWPDIPVLVLSVAARTSDSIGVRFVRGMRIVDVVTARPLSSGFALAVHLPSLFSTALRLFPAAFTASLTSVLLAPVFALS